MERPLTEVEKEKIANLGELQYPMGRCALVLDDGVIDHPDFEAIYERGKVRGQFVIDLKIKEMAEQGDLKAVTKLEQRQRLLAREK